jgi:hypothetical protein
MDAAYLGRGQPGGGGLPRQDFTCAGPPVALVFIGVALAVIPVVFRFAVLDVGIRALVGVPRCLQNFMPHTAGCVGSLAGP